MKFLILIVLLIVLLFIIIACGKDKSQDSNNEQGYLTITGIVIDNMSEYNAQYFSYHNQYGSVGIRTFGFRFDTPVTLASGETITEAEFKYDRIGGEELQTISPTGEIINTDLVGTPVTLTGLIREIPDFAELSEITDGRYSVDYFFSPNGQFEFILVNN